MKYNGLLLLHYWLQNRFSGNSLLQTSLYTIFQTDGEGHRKNRWYLKLQWLFIEATAMKGKNGLTLTGQLGDVMKESATAALSFARANASDLGIDEDFFDSHDLHIHIPAGAIPKDGPSAGVTMLTALTSLLTDTRIPRDLAMTGEITLRGQVLPVGGVKEKVLAAHRAGIKTIILPAWNRRDLEDIPKKVETDIKFHFVDKMLDVIHIALGNKKPRPVGKRRKNK